MARIREALVSLAIAAEWIPGVTWILNKLDDWSEP